MGFLDKAKEKAEEETRKVAEATKKAGAKGVAEAKKAGVEGAEETPKKRRQNVKKMQNLTNCSFSLQSEN